MKTRASIFILLACYALTVFATERKPSHDDRPAELVFGMTPVLGVAATRKQFSRFTEYMSERLDMPVKLLVSESYGNLIDKVEAGEVDVVKFSPLAYVRALKRVPDLQLFASHVASGSTTYSSYLVATHDNRFEKLQDLRGSKICYADPDSASGYLYPSAYLLKHGLHPGRDFSSVTFGGDHRTCMRGLFDGRYDVAATFSGALENARLSGLPVGELVIVVKTGRIPYDAYCVRAGLDEQLARRIKDVFLNTNTLDRTGRRVLSPTGGINGWVEVSDAHYDGIREVEATVSRLRTAGKENPAEDQ